ncbi:MAG: MFS transporter [Gammaproteobacteria bacterium]|nr:MFS transporter [Gammaproteobacteria bacterium]
MNTVTNTGSPYKWWIFLGGGLMIFLANIDATIVSLALATIAKTLHTGLSEIQWIINSYLLTTVIFFIIGGKLSDIFGRKNIYLIGVIFFGAASLVCGIADNYPLLLIGRLFQGVGFAFTLSLALLIIAKSFPDEQRGFAVGLSVTIAGIGQALGPTIGGAILQELSWHWIFLINIPFAVISFIITSIFYKRIHFTDSSQKKIDYSGAILLAITTSILLIALNDLTHDNVNVELVVIGIIASLVFAGLFYFKEIKTRLPLIDFTLFKNRDYTLSIIIRFLFTFCYGSFLFFIPLFLQNILGFEPLMAGLMMLIYSALFAVASPMAGIWCDQVSYKPPIVFSIALSLIAFILLSILHLHSAIYLILLAFAIFGIATGIHIPSTVQSTLSTLPEKNSGEGLGMFFTFTFIGYSLGVAVSGAIMNFSSRHFMLLQHLTLLKNLTPQQFLIVRHVANGTQPSQYMAEMFSPAQLKTVATLTKQSFMHGLSITMWTSVIIFAITFIIALMLKPNKGAKAER